MACPGFNPMAESLGNLARIEGFKVNVEQNGKSVVLQGGDDAGLSFQALVQNIAAIDPDMLLGSDIREACYVETLREWVPSTLLTANAKSQIAATIDGTRVDMVRREDNWANPFVRFEVVKVL